MLQNHPLLRRLNSWEISSRRKNYDWHWYYQFFWGVGRAINLLLHNVDTHAVCWRNHNAPHDIYYDAPRSVCHSSICWGIPGLIPRLDTAVFTKPEEGWGPSSHSNFSCGHNMSSLERYIRLSDDLSDDRSYFLYQWPVWWLAVGRFSVTTGFKPTP